MTKSGSSKTNQPADAMVIFGISGDLAKKMTFQSLYRLELTKKLNCPIIGVAKEAWGRDDLIRRMEESVRSLVKDPDGAVISRLAKRLDYVGGDLLSPDTYRALSEKLQGFERVLFYLEIPPALFSRVANQLANANLLSGAMVLFEKPFGHDLASARQLNQELHEVLNESQILRIDHFLGKQPLIDLHFIRFANGWLEPLLNRDHISTIQVNMTEDFGVEDRGAFYDPVGAMRDVVQNHLMQVVALALMDAPVRNDYDALWDRKTEVFSAMPEVKPANVIKGQYIGYRDIPGVAPDSRTETYIALRLEVDSWRWSGVPIFIRAGKALKKTATEIRFVFKPAPKTSYLGSLGGHPNQLVLRIDPTSAMRLTFLSRKSSGASMTTVHMDLPFEEELGVPPQPYERLLHDALGGDRSLFSRQDAIEETWRVLDPILSMDVSPYPYEKGSWGPNEADSLVAGHLSWQEPWV
jgi:glucose-6-phosphate 1-dehydrogenase